MTLHFPSPVPEIPVNDLHKSVNYYERNLGFTIDWTGDGIAGVSRGSCRLFLTDSAFRAGSKNNPPVVIWQNASSIEEVNELYASLHATVATIVALPESKPWGLYEFAVADPDGNRFRIFYDFATPERERNAQA